ncbi:MAG: hypothetical protein JO069_01000 [Verrucomicrobia bacterium]|nr:hypothetical protein [Verrucomicrobiota bacterium]
MKTFDELSDRTTRTLIGRQVVDERGEGLGTLHKWLSANNSAFQTLEDQLEAFTSPLRCKRRVWLRDFVTQSLPKCTASPFNCR